MDGNNNIYIQIDGGVNNTSTVNSNENSMDGKETTADKGASRSGKGLSLIKIKITFPPNLFWYNQAVTFIFHSKDTELIPIDHVWS